MTQISQLLAHCCAAPCRYLLAGLLGATLVGTGLPAWANSDDGYTDRLVAEFAPWVGSPQEAETLAQSLRSGQPAGSGAASVVPATGALGYGEARLALKLAQGTLAQEGITQPSDAQIHAALHGGVLETANGPKQLPGVLPQRAQGLSWGTMAQSAGVSVEDLIPPRSAAPKKAPTTKASKAKKKAGAKPAAKAAGKKPAKTAPKKTGK